MFTSGGEERVKPPRGKGRPHPPTNEREDIFFAPVTTLQKKAFICENFAPIVDKKLYGCFRQREFQKLSLTFMLAPRGYVQKSGLGAFCNKKRKLVERIKKK